MSRGPISLFKCGVLPACCPLSSGLMVYTEATCFSHLRSLAVHTSACSSLVNGEVCLYYTWTTCPSTRSRRHHKDLLSLLSGRQTWKSLRKMPMQCRLIMERWLQELIALLTCSLLITVSEHLDILPELANPF